MVQVKRWRCRLAAHVTIPDQSFVRSQKNACFPVSILVVSWNYPPRRGGIESLVSNLCAGLRERHAVLVITAHAQSLPQVESNVFRAPWPGLIPFAFYALWRGATLLFHNPAIGVIFGGSVLVTPVVLILARLFGRKVVVQAHGLDVVYSSRLYQTLCVRWLKFCDRIIANSSYTASLVAQTVPSKERISVIAPGVYPERFNLKPDVEAFKKQWALEDRQVILFVGRLARRKGVREFVEKSLAKIVQHMPAVCFVVVGDNPTESLTRQDDALSEIVATIDDMKLQNHVRLLGTLSDDEVVRLYQLCDVVVLPALASPNDVEGFGIVLLEAAAAGKPTVATRVGGIPDVVEDGKSGILVEPDDHDGLSRALIDLLGDDKKRLTSGHYAKNRVNEQFSWDRVVTAYEKTLDDLA
jgi:phosphatidylinositol alpha-1,6-mannosyltransferase